MQDKHSDIDHVLSNLNIKSDIDERILELESGTFVVLDEITCDDANGIYKGCVSQIDGEKKNLGVNGRLLHGVCFYYHKATNILAIESDNKSVSPNRFFEYLHTFEADFNGKLKVVLDKDKLVNIQTETPKSIEIAVADPGQAIGVDGQAGQFLSSLEDACNQFDGNKITVTVTAGRSPKRKLADGLAPALRDILDAAAAGKLNLKKLKAKTAESKDNNQDKPYNLLGQILRYTDEIELPKDDHAAKYEASMKLVERAFVANKAYLEKYT
jgi:hypothetical protein